MEYYFKIPPQTETNVTYVVNWDIVAVYQLDDGSTNFSMVIANESESIRGTGDPTNGVSGIVQYDLDTPPPFFASATVGGTCTMSVENVTVHEIANSGGNSPPGVGPGFGSEGGGSGCCGHDGGMLAEFGLGSVMFGQTAGILRIWSAVPDSTLATPTDLNFIGDTNSITVVLTNNQLRQVYAPQALADIVINNAYSYEIRYYYSSQVGELTNGIYQLSGTPFVTWMVQNPSTDISYNTILLTETRGSNIWDYNYTYDPSANSWTYVSPGGVRQLQLTTTYNSDGTRTLSSVTGTTNGTPARIFSRTYQEFSWGEGVVSQEVNGTGASAKITTKTYYDDKEPANGTFVPLEQVVNPDGSWQYHDYTQLGDGTWVIADVYTGFGDSQANGSFGGSTYQLPSSLLLL